MRQFPLNRYTLPDSNPVFSPVEWLCSGPLPSALEVLLVSVSKDECILHIFGFLSVTVLSVALKLSLGTSCSATASFQQATKM
jgi:hypothetical protein